MKKHNPSIILLMSALVLGLTACGPKSGSEAQAGASNESAVTDPAGDFLLSEVPSTVPGLLEALEAGGEGETLLFTGRVGGNLDPMAADYAAFVVADEVLVFCDEMGDDDHCPTPWDACCEDPDKIAASRAFVQFVDDNGLPLAVDLKEAVGLAENDAVIVRGKLSPDSTPGNRIIIADGLAIVE